MPFWWTRKQWQEQFLQEVTSQCYANIEVIRADYEADDFMRYCPSWSAPNKAGCLSKGKCKLSALVEISQGKKKKLKPLTRFCQICRREDVDKEGGEEDVDKGTEEGIEGTAD